MFVVGQLSMYTSNIYLVDQVLVSMWHMDPHSLNPCLMEAGLQMECVEFQKLYIAPG